MEAATDGAQSIEDMANNGEAEGEDEIVVGTHGQLSFTIGGKKPTTSKVSLGSAGREVDGQFQKGDVVSFLVTARCNEIVLTDKHDNVGTAIECIRTHKFAAQSVRVVESANDE